MAKRIRLAKRVVAESDRLAAELAARFSAVGVFVANLMSSPGSGKTSLLEETARRMAGEFRMAVIEGDLATDRDAQRILRAGIPCRQINTGGGCHLSARQVLDALEAFNLADLDVLFIENVGNLVCPAEFDLGERRRVVLASTPEGDDKPLKYPVAFHKADCVVLNKIDLLAAAGFSREAFLQYVRGVAPGVPVLELSCRTGEGLDAWLDWVRAECRAARRGEPRPARR
ncbi:MAG: hydrogenase nickel incorporation protein HypB [Planctomycetes bacterium]|nr:hydrogenase nickel incorporation protein HypB [Planctomycetota bacterium]